MKTAHLKPLLLLLPLICMGDATSQTARDQREALRTIAEFADRLCQTVPITTSADRIELSGSARADLDGLIKRLTNLGVTGAAKYEHAATQNVLQKDLAEVLRDSRNCRMQIWNDLKGKIVGMSPDRPAISKGAQEATALRPPAKPVKREKSKESDNAAPSPAPIQLTCGDLRGTKLTQTMMLDRSKYIYPERTLEDWFLQNAVPASVNQNQEPYQIASVYHIVTSTQEAAEEVLNKLNAGECWSAVAKRYSIDEATRNTTGRIHASSSRGIRISSLPPEVADVVKRLRADEYSSTPIKSALGWHVVAVTDKE